MSRTALRDASVRDPLQPGGTLFDSIYAAGLFEGEGYLAIKKNRPRGKTSHTLELRINMCDPEPLRRFHHLWGGALRHYERQEAGWRDSYHWDLSSRQAARFLAEIRPYLLTVRYQTRVDLALAFQAQKTHRITHAKREAYVQLQEEFYNAMRELTRRGSASLNDEERFATLVGMGVAP